MTHSSARTVARLYLVVLVANLLLAMGLGMYGGFTGTGLAGYFLSLQLEWFGRGSMMVTFLLTMAVLMIPSMVLAWLLKFLGPEMSEALQAVMVGKPGVTPPPRSMDGGLSWGVVFGVTLALLLGTLGLAGALYWRNMRDQAAGVQEIDLDRAAEPPSNGAAYVTLTGHVAHPFLTGFEEKSTRSSGSASVQVFAPVTGAGWSQGAPVRYFVRYKTRGSGNMAASLPVALRQRGATRISGKLGGTLPVFVAREYASQGLKVEPGHQVVDWGPLPDGEAPLDDSHLVALAIGGFITVCTFGSLAGAKAVNAWKTRHA